MRQGRRLVFLRSRRLTSWNVERRASRCMRLAAPSTRTMARFQSLRSFSGYWGIGLLMRSVPRGQAIGYVLTRSAARISVTENSVAPSRSAQDNYGHASDAVTGDHLHRRSNQKSELPALARKQLQRSALHRLVSCCLTSAVRTRSGMAVVCASQSVLLP